MENTKNEITAQTERTYTKEQVLNFASYVREGLSMNDWANQEVDEHFNYWQMEHKMNWK